MYLNWWMRVREENSALLSYKNAKSLLARDGGEANRNKPNLTLIVSGTVGLVLLSLLAVAFVFVTFNEQKRVNKGILDTAEHTLLSIEASHTQAMLNRGDREDDNPVIRAMDGTLRHISETQENLTAWLVMGQKVLDYQAGRGNEVEPPKDDVDLEALKTGRTVSRFVEGKVFRLTRPVVLGQGNAGRPECLACHGAQMGLRAGDVIGAFSISYDAGGLYAVFYDFRWETGALFLVILIFVSAVIAYLIHRFVGRPTHEIAAAMRQIADGREDVQIPASADSRELAEIIAATQVFKEYASSTYEELRFQKRALDEHDIVSIADVKGNITYVNDKFCEISGYCQDELLGKNHRILKSDEHPRAFYRDLWRTIANGKPWHGEIKNFRKNGGFYWVKATIVPFLNKEGKPIRYVAIRTDITESKNAETTLRESKRELEEHVIELDSSKSHLERQAAKLVELAENEAMLGEKLKYESDVKDRFFSIISHDLKSPFTSLLGMTRIMSKMGGKLSKDKLIDYSASVNEAGERVFELLQNLLEWSRLQMEGGAFEPKVIALREVAQESVDILKPIALEKDIRLTNKVNTAAAFADRDMTQAVIRNLIANSLKFTSPGGSVEVSSQTEGNGVRVTVTDTGAGMSADQAEKIFSLDQNTSTTGTAGEKGTGLGLPLCKDMLERNGGRIWVESKPGEGSRFHFTLPSGAREE